MGAHSRNKGAAFEREIAGRLLGLTGVTFKRNLVQTQEADHSDLVPDDPEWPFSIECKRYADGTGCAPAWREQAKKSAIRDKRLPAVIYKFDRRDVLVSVPFAAWGDGNLNQWAEVTLEGFAYLAAEIMAAKAAADL